MQCLFIDDDSDDQELFAIALSAVAPDAVCLFASNGSDGLKLLQGQSELPDFIFLDLNMPKLGGKDCLRAIKSDERLKHIPVIIFTTSSDPRDKEDAAALGAAGFITKPHRIVDLETMLQRFLETHSQELTR